jgi:glutathione S-transferase
MMDLHMTATSPFARKVRVVARERGLPLTEIHTMPLESEAIRAFNPLGKIPALVLQNGEVIFDSPVIVDYLDAIAPGTPMLPRDPLQRIAHVRWQALADGILDSAIAYRFEVGFHQDAAQSETLKDRHLSAIHAGLDLAEQTLSQLPTGFCLPHIALCCMLDYLDFRFAALNVRTVRPKLAAMAAAHAGRASLADTPHPQA